MLWKSLGFNSIFLGTPQLSGNESSPMPKKDFFVVGHDIVHAFSFILNTFISNASLKLAYSET